MSNFTVTRPGTLTDTELKPLIDMYRQVVAQRYTPCGPTDIDRLLGAPPFHVSRKIDGELWFLRGMADATQLIAANGRIAEGDAPVITPGTVPDGTVLAGELHVHKGDVRERVGDVPAALNANPDTLVFAAFDVIQHGDSSWRDLPYARRLEILTELMPQSGPVHVVPVTTVSSAADVNGLYQDLVETTGAEGIVVRCADGRALKVKPDITLDLAILGFTTRQGPAGEEARSLLIGLHSSDGAWVPLGTAGNFVEGIDRQHLLEMLVPLEMPSSYRKAASSGQLYRMVRPEILVECRVLDLQTLDSKDRPIRQPQLRVEADQWSVAGQLAAATAINPIVLRLRTDKPDAQEGARWQQIETLIPSGQQSDSAAAGHTILRRQVWTKTAKEKSDVRKLVVWKTNRDLTDPSYPAYVVHWTDYSAGRKTPLTREVRPAFTEESAHELAEALIETNIKKGWAPEDQ